MSIATCPKCHRQVSLPTTDDHSVWVRCPLCSEQYSLRMALDHVPPMLEILGPPAEGQMVDFGAVSAEAASIGEHAAGLAPGMGAEHFPQPDQSANGEQGLELDHAAPGEHPPGLDKVNGLQKEHDGTEPLGEFDLELAEHGESMDHSEHGGIGQHADHGEDVAAAALGEYQGDHRIEPGLGEHEGDPEFQFAGDEAGEGMEEEDAGEERHSMGGIATLVKTAPPAKKRREAPMIVKLIGVLVGLGFGLIGCYLVFGAFLWMGNSFAASLAVNFHLKHIYPPFINKHVPDEVVQVRQRKPPEKPSLGSNPATPTTGTVDTNPAPTPAVPTGTQDNSTKAPTPGDNTTAVNPPKKPGANDLAQQSPDKSNTPLETTEDPSKAPPPDLDKGDATKPDASGIAPPKFDSSAPPFGDVKPPVAPKTNVDPTDKPPPEKTTVDKPIVDKPATDKPATDKPAADKPVTDKPENPIPAPSTEKPSEKPIETPTTPADAKSPIAAQLDNVDAAVAATVQSQDKLKAATAPGAEPSTVLRARVAQYKAMSHLVTELGAVDAAAADPDSKTRIEQLDKKAAALAESMGSAAARDTTAMLAGKWIASPSRKGSGENGAVVVGTLVKVEPTEKGFVAHIKMPSDSSEMIFTTTKKPEAADGSTVVVLGLLNADGGGTALDIVSPNDEKTPATAPSDSTTKPADSDKPAGDKLPADKPTDKDAPATADKSGKTPAASALPLTPETTDKSGADKLPAAPNPAKP